MPRYCLCIKQLELLGYSPFPSKTKYPSPYGGGYFASTLQAELLAEDLIISYEPSIVH